jgi:hypothetical protein
MTLQEILRDYAAALEIVRLVSKAEYNDCVAAYIIDEDAVAAANILLREQEEV